MGFPTAHLKNIYVALIDRYKIRKESQQGEAKGNNDVS